MSTQTKSRGEIGVRRRLPRRQRGRLVSLLVAFSLLLAPGWNPQPPAAQAEALASPQPHQVAPERETVAPAAGTSPLEEMASGPVCSDTPPTGQRAMLLAEDEVVVAWHYKAVNTTLQNTIMDNAGVLLNTSSSRDFGAYDALTDVDWPAVTVADLNGDGHGELVTVVRDKYKRVSLVTSAGGTPWYRDVGNVVGDNVRWLDIAAGNLDRSSWDDDEVVIAFANEADDLTMWLFNGSAEGNINHAPNNYSAWYWDDQAGRGHVRYTVLETGDLNGDGYDDEIVTAFQDGNDDLQVMILRRESTELTVLWSKAWTTHDRGDTADDKSGYANERPIDVTTGDVDGDKSDEVIVAFRDGNYDDKCYGHLQLLVLDYEESAGQVTVDDGVFLQRDVETAACSSSTGCGRAPTSISVSAADLDGDGRDEIALGFNVVSANDSGDRAWQQHLRTYEYVPVGGAGWDGCSDDEGHLVPCLKGRSGPWDSPYIGIPAAISEAATPAHVVIATGDIDQDGMAEIALARVTTASDTSDLRVFTFDADTGLYQRDWEDVYHYSPEGYSYSEPIQEFWLAMGDQNGDSKYGDYTGACYEKSQAQIQAVIQAPPFWEENDHQAEAGFGEKVGTGGGTGETTETSIGGSVTLGFEIKETVGASLTRGWEKSAAVENTLMTTTVEGDSFHTCPPEICGDNAYWNGVELLETRYWCWTYNQAELGDMDVCLPQPDQLAKVPYSLNTWYTQGMSDYPDSWVPVGINLAQGRPATQSSTYTSGQYSGPANLAVDGNTNGDFYAGSVSHTNQDPYPYYSWWQVDLQGEQWLDAIQAWNRTDNNCGVRLHDFYLFVSDEPFASNDPSVVANDPNVWHHMVAGQCGRPTTVSVGRHGRYVRVQLTEQNNLQLAEVQVWGRPGAPDLWPTTRPVSTAANDGFQISWPGGRVQTVAGELMYTRQGTALGVRMNSLPVEFDLGQEREGEQVTEDSSENTRSIGLEVHKRKAEGGLDLDWSDKQTTSYITSWSNEIEFSGEVGGIGLPSSAYSYDYMPYIWLQRAKSSGGVDQAFLVLDYWVPSVAASAAGEEAATPVANPTALGPAVAPAIPLIDSSTHPDPATWYTDTTATFDWAQPAGDPAIVAGYRWYLDHDPAAVPPGANLGLVTTDTYHELDDGVWYLHVRAMSDGGEWGEAGHRAVRVDANPPQVQLTMDPPQPTGNNGWYVTPITATVAVTDGAGSGVAAVEVSTDGVTWQPYGGPLSFAADTAGTTLYARASDVLGHVSEPVSTTLKIDMTPPDSHITGGQGPGVWIAQVITNTMGNQELVLAGAIADDGSGRAGMALEIDGQNWTSAKPIGVWHPIPGQPEIEVNWYFTATQELGAGNHIFTGRAQDEAGNQEEAYEIGQVLWFPQASPDLDGSTLAAEPATVRPGEIVAFKLVARNAGFQEALVEASDVLPAGLEPVAELLTPGVTYDPATRTLTWPPRLLWPGQWARYVVLTRADVGLSASTLENEATFHAYWPNTDSLPPEQRQRFLDHEQTVVVSATVNVDPELAAGADVTPPWVGLLPLSGQQASDGQVQLSMVAAPDARWMYLREWTLDPASGDWTVARSSGWISYTQTLPWTLSDGQGVKYLGVWVADRAHNISTLDEHTLGFVNRFDGVQALADGQRVQYRGDVLRGTWVVATLTTVSGDPDLYIWYPRNGFRPNLASDDAVLPGQLENIGGQLMEYTGRYVLEVQAVGNSEYQLILAGHDQESASMHNQTNKPRPQHPLVVSDPLSAGQVGPVVVMRSTYLPVMLETR